MGQTLRNAFYRSVDPVAERLAGWGVRPNTMTALGLALAALAGLAYGLGYLFLGGVLLACSGICDALDGLVARRSGWEYKLGAFLDSSVDRVGEALVGLGLFAFLLNARSGELVSPDWFAAGVLALAVFLLASQLVSYVKARAEALGAECRIGLMQRPERLIGLVFLSWMAVWPGPGVNILIVGLSLMALLTAFTVYQRFVHVLKSLDQAGGR